MTALRQGSVVIPAKAGIQYPDMHRTAARAAVPQILLLRFWTPAFAGVTGRRS
jgi:hypothetical protein